MGKLLEEVSKLSVVSRPSVRRTLFSDSARCWEAGLGRFATLFLRT